MANKGGLIGKGAIEGIEVITPVIGKVLTMNIAKHIKIFIEEMNKPLKSKEEIARMVQSMMELMQDRFVGLSEESMVSVKKILTTVVSERTFEQKMKAGLVAALGGDWGDLASISKIISVKGAAKAASLIAGKISTVVTALSILDAIYDDVRHRTPHDQMLEPLIKEDDPRKHEMARTNVALHEKKVEQIRTGKLPDMGKIPDGVNVAKWKNSAQYIAWSAVWEKANKYPAGPGSSDNLPPISLQYPVGPGEGAEHAPTPIQSDFEGITNAIEKLRDVGDEQFEALSQRTVDWGDMTEDTMDAVSTQTYDLGEGVDLVFGQIGDGTSVLTEANRTMSESAVVDYGNARTAVTGWGDETETSFYNAETAASGWGDNTMLAFAGVGQEAGTVHISEDFLVSMRDKNSKKQDISPDIFL